MAATVSRLDRRARDPVAGGFYTVRDACRLLSITQPARVVGWLQGYRKSSSGPIIQRSYAPIGGAQEVSFLDLLEVRFVEHFRKQDVPLQSLRKAAETLRELLKQSHPFATSSSMFMTDRRQVFQSTAKEVGDNILLNLVTKQYEMYAVLEEVLARGIAFDPATGVALEWKPHPTQFSSIVLNPLISFGRPCVMPVGIPTETLLKSWKAEDGSYNAVADWYQVTQQQVREAVEFELGLPN